MTRFLLLRVSFTVRYRTPTDITREDFICTDGVVKLRARSRRCATMTRSKFQAVRRHTESGALRIYILLLPLLGTGIRKEA